jgi:flagellar biosynthesis protein FlhF
MELIAPAQPPNGPLIIALVGPTGAGKTTTAAKLATHPRVFGNRRVGLLGLDTYRIGGADQLRTYAAIARLECDVAYGVDDLARARKALGSCDVILVDTPGRSPRQRQDREFTEELLRRLEPAEVHLTIPAGTAAHLAAAMIKDLRSPKVTHLLVTKCDEASDEFGLFEMAVDLKLPVRWATDGQEVPLDVRSAADAVDAVRAYD